MKSEQNNALRLTDLLNFKINNRPNPFVLVCETERFDDYDLVFVHCSTFLCAVYFANKILIVPRRSNLSSTFSTPTQSATGTLQRLYIQTVRVPSNTLTSMTHAHTRTAIIFILTFEKCTL